MSQMLKNRGMPRTGIKTDFEERLLDDDENQIGFQQNEKLTAQKAKVQAPYTAPLTPLTPASEEEEEQQKLRRR